MSEERICSFCDKLEKDTKVLIVRNAVAICYECINVAALEVAPKKSFEMDRWGQPITSAQRLGFHECECSCAKDTREAFAQERKDQNSKVKTLQEQVDLEKASAEWWQKRAEKLEAAQQRADENAAPDERAASALEAIESLLREALNEGWG